MNQQAQPTTLPIKAEYKWSADELIAGLKIHLRDNQGAMRFIPYLGGFMIFGFFFSMFWGKQSFFSTFPLALLGTFFLLINHFIYWQCLRSFRNNPNRDVQIAWAFTNENLSSAGEGFNQSLAWGKVFKFVDSPKGFLIYPQKLLYYWIPFAGFANESEIDHVRQIARSHVSNYKKVG